MEQSNYLLAGFLLAIASACLFALSILTGLFLPDAGETTGFQLFVLPFAVLAFLLTLMSTKETLDDREKKQFKFSLALSIIMIVLPIGVMVVANILN